MEYHGEPAYAAIFDQPMIKADQRNAREGSSADEELFRGPRDNACVLEHVDVQVPNVSVPAILAIGEEDHEI